MPFAEYLQASVLDPLGLAGAELQGRPSEGLHGTLADLAAFGRELLAPTLVAAETLDEATEVVFPGLVGVLPGLGRQEPNDWGLGFELKDAKRPHWTGSANSPRTFGHFGGAGTFLWVDPDARVACACLTDLEFGEWAQEAPSWRSSCCAPVKLSRIIGVPDARLDEIVVACIVCKDGAEADRGRHPRVPAASGSSSYKVPKRVLFFADGEIPMTASDTKVRDEALLELVLERLAEPTQP